MQKHLGDLLYQANKELIKVVNSKLAPMKTGYSQLQTLMTIVQLGDGNELDQEILAETMQVDKSNVSRNLSKMQRDGFIEIVQSEKDGRKKRIILTGKAQDSILALKEILNGINRQMTAGLDASQQEQAIRSLTQVIQNLEEMK